MPNQQGGLVRAISGILLKIVKSPKTRYKIWRAAEKQFSKYDVADCNYVGELVTGFHTINMKFAKEWFAEPKETLFEGYSFLGPTNMEAYTRVRYGDYMQIPPVEEQVPKMRPAFVDLKTPYKQYKGIHYCIVGGAESKKE